MAGIRTYLESLNARSNVINLTLFQSNRCHRHKLIRAALMQLDGPNEGYEMIPTRASPPISTLRYATTLS